MTEGQPRVQRTRLATELRRQRMLAGVSGREVARHVGIGQASVSRIENAQAVPSLPEVKAWADAVRASDESRESLFALTEAALNEVESWRARMRGGLVAIQADAYELEASAHTVRNFQPAVVPGMLQTAEYARRVFELTDVLGGNDYAGAVAARVERQQMLYDRDRTFEYIIAESVLRARLVPSTVLAAQLDRIATVATLSNVEIGVLPTGATVHAIPWVGFDIYEDREEGLQPFVLIETPHAGMTITDPADVKIYHEQFSLIREAAIFGDEVAALLSEITTELRE